MNFEFIVNIIVQVWRSFKFINCLHDSNWRTLAPKTVFLHLYHAFTFLLSLIPIDWLTNFINFSHIKYLILIEEPYCREQFSYISSARVSDLSWYSRKWHEPAHKHITAYTVGIQRKSWKWSDIFVCFNVGYKSNKK